jgi:hypothetical protein
MDSETYAWEHPSLSMDVVSCLSAISTGIASNPISYPGTFLQVSHGPPVLEEVPTNSLPLDIIEYPAQVNAKVGYVVLCGASSVYQLNGYSDMYRRSLPIDTACSHPG